MVLAVPPAKWEEFSKLCAAEDVEATVIGQFVPTGRLKLLYHEQPVADLAMEFLHDGRPPVVREAAYAPPAEKPLVAARASQATITRQTWCEILRLAGMWPARNGSSGNTITRCKAAAS